ncbi:hypothetical protein [Bradyrhizobium sp. URHD0069]|uniref:hypothetical protein n=1 Tax=Bradyrhizobium sp. URHD0069 TaxID=1380355 RepID=UPI0004951455|nr:hypothetical protein [Bradyrhizobium sp. URHD0069]
MTQPQDGPELDPLEMLLDAARFIERDKPGWAKSARAAVAQARLAPSGADGVRTALEASSQMLEYLRREARSWGKDFTVNVDHALDKNRNALAALSTIKPADAAAGREEIREIIAFVSSQRQHYIAPALRDQILNKLIALQQSGATP